MIASELARRFYVRLRFGRDCAGNSLDRFSRARQFVNATWALPERAHEPSSSFFSFISGVECSAHFSFLPNRHNNPHVFKDPVPVLVTLCFGVEECTPACFL
jgi:hypothetical protein